jgi:hypothetical protein
MVDRLERLVEQLVHLAHPILRTPGRGDGCMMDGLPHVDDRLLLLIGLRLP